MLFGKSRFLIFIFLCGIGFGTLSCETINGFFSSEKSSSQKTSKSKKNKTPKKKFSAKKDDAKKPNKKPGSNSNLIINKNKNSAKLSLKKIKNNSAKKSFQNTKVPLQITKTIGDSPKNIFADNNYIYIEDSQHLNLFDKDFNHLDKIKKISKIKTLKRINLNSKTWLYTEQENNIFEIFELVVPAGDKKPYLEFATGFDVDGDFSWLDPKTLLVFLEDALQIVDFSDWDNVQIKKEFPLANVTDKLILTNYLYVARREFLDILSLDGFDLKASVRIGQNYKFLGAIQKNGKNFLHVALLNKEKEITGIQTLTLTPNLSGVIDFGPIHFLKTKLNTVDIDLKNNLLVGQSSNSPRELLVYSIDHHKFLRGPFAYEKDVVATKHVGDLLYVIRNNEMGRYRIVLDNDVIKNASAEPKTKNEGPSNLAQIGAPITLKNEYNLQKLKAKDLNLFSKEIFLLDQNHLIVHEQTPESHLKISENLTNENFSTRTLSLPDKIAIAKFLPTPFGLIFSNQKGQTFFTDVFFKTVTPFNLEFQNLVSWKIFKDGTKYKLATISKNRAQKRFSKQTNSSTHPFTFELFELSSPTKIDLVTQMPLANKTHLLNIGYNTLLLVSQNKVDYLSLRNAEKPRFLMSESKTIKLPGLLRDAKLSPKKDQLYLLIRKQDQHIIRILDLQKPAVFVDFKIQNLKLSQFQNSSFTKGGNIFILPTEDGTFFYNVTTLEAELTQEQRLQGFWSQPSEAVDVANRGQFICISLGNGGVSCGNTSL